MKFVVVFLHQHKENFAAQGYKYSYKVSPLCSKYSCCCFYYMVAVGMSLSLMMMRCMFVEFVYLEGKFVALVQRLMVVGALHLDKQEGDTAT